MNKTIASFYPAPFDAQIRHELNASIFNQGNIYAYEEGKITSVKNDGTCLFPERSILMGLKELNLKPNDIDLWVIPKTKKINFNDMYLFFSTFLKAYIGDKSKFKKWFKKKVKIIKHHDLHIFSAIGTSNFENGVYFNIDGGGDAGDNRHTTWGTFNKKKIKRI